MLPDPLGSLRRLFGLRLGISSVETGVGIWMGYPQDGQEIALSETECPHSGHKIKAIMKQPPKIS